ncbi:Transcription factor [Sesamum angolense]|uniref:Transcription factor n=1 Tax=Sesamum angolense TaxID=2727404 RepID=A0AAE1X4I2_9LAMI|nr:Transcription factor [Sesamum angolense]
MGVDESWHACGTNGPHSLDPATASATPSTPNRVSKSGYRKLPSFTPIILFLFPFHYPDPTMAGNGAGFEDDPMAPGCYSQLLFSDDISGLDPDGCFGFTSSFPSDDSNSNNSNIHTPKMLCFGDFAKQSNAKVAVENARKTGQRSGPASCSDPSSVSSTNNTKIRSSLHNSTRKRNGSGIQNPDGCAGAPAGSQRNSKKSKSNSFTVGGHAKTDTASVLHEALGYIRFLHDQVQVLCSPYLQCSSSSSEALQGPDDGESKEGQRKRDDLRSRGLCLIPMELTLHVADSNGADLWSSAAMVDSVSLN